MKNRKRRTRKISPGYVGLLRAIAGNNWYVLACWQMKKACS